jgi:S-formylglutathione hydrolase FrmB
VPSNDIRERALKGRRAGSTNSGADRLAAARNAFAGILGAFAVLALVFVFNVVYASNTTLQDMGFDTGRAQLISALIIGGVAAASSTLIDGRIGRSALYGSAVAGIIFGETFASETSDALGSTGAMGSFDAGGWVITALSLAFIAMVSAWAGATLAGGLRPALIEAGHTVAAVARRQGVDGRARARLARTAVVALLVVVTVPVFSDLVNLTPDARMLHGGAQVQGLSADAMPTLVPAVTQIPDPSPSSTSESPSPSPTAKPTLSLADHPWLAWKPAGSGRVTTVAMTAPWKGAAATAEVVIYTPPGFNAHGSIKYPVIYETPSPYALWDGGTNVGVALDLLIDGGEMPATIVAFISSAGGYYVDSQCANSYDGREWFDKYVTQTVVAWVDSHYPTIAAPQARAIAGMSQGGFCAANLALRHPDVFGTSISFSGYFHAGFGGSASADVFGHNKAFMEANSPDIVAGKVAVSVRSNLYFILVAKPDQPGYGAQAADFEKILTTDGYPSVRIAAKDPHGWVQVRNETPVAFEAWAARMAGTGVFG